jgi:hypothetical protein
MAREHAPGIDVVCLTDTPTLVEMYGVRAIRLKHDWPAVWSKIELFRPGLFDGPVVYLDLDTVIIGDVRYLRRSRLSIMVDPNGVTPFCTTAMSWEGDDAGHLYDRMSAHPHSVMHSFSQSKYRDQGYICARHPEIDPLPGVVSFKAHCRNAPPKDPNVVAVAFHGKPKPNDPAAGWGFKIWRTK